MSKEDAMKNWIHWITALLLALAPLTFTACGGDESGPNEPTTETPPDEVEDPDGTEQPLTAVPVRFRVMNVQLDMSELTVDITGENVSLTLPLDKTVELEPGAYDFVVTGPMIEPAEDRFMVRDDAPEVNVSVEVTPVTIEPPAELDGTEDCNTVRAHPEWNWLARAEGVNYACGRNDCTLQLTDDPEGCGAKCQPAFYQGFLDLTHTNDIAFEFTDENGTFECIPASSQ